MFLARATNDQLPLHPRTQPSALRQRLQFSVVLFPSLHARNVAEKSERAETNRPAAEHRSLKIAVLFILVPINIFIYLLASEK